jgi:hypothetical protein
MAVRNWHRSKIALLWFAYLFVVLITWTVNARITDEYVSLLQVWLAWAWFALFVPLFVTTWRWASARESRQVSQAASVLVDAAMIRHAVLNSAINGTVLILRTNYGSEFHGRVVREGPSSLELLPKDSKKLISFGFDEIKSVTISDNQDIRRLS